jgi:hypothetical protein
LGTNRIRYNLGTMAIITFLGNFEVDYSSETHHAKTLQSLGHKVVKLQERKVTSEQVYKSAQKADLFIWVHTHGWKTPGRMSMEDVLIKLKEDSVPTMTYHLDLWFGLKRQDDLSNDNFYKTIGHFFTVDKLMADWFNENTDVKGHYILPGVYEPECYIHNSYGTGYDYDIIFVGSKGYHPEYPYRPTLIDFLKKTYGNRFTHVGGDGDTGTIRGDKLNKVYARSKVAIGDSLNLNFDYPYYTSDRLFESTGRGGFTIYPAIKGLEDTFTKNEIVWYEHGNLNELVHTINHYLENETEREKIRIAGHERTKADHTYTNRWKKILGEFNL